jgi:hypothetical protein
MFQENGNWKEFGVNQDTKHTWFPFWLFCISWAFISYGLSSFTYSMMGNDNGGNDNGNGSNNNGNGSNDNETNNNIVELNETNNKNSKNSKNSKKSKNDMKSGYYVLDKEAYENNGIPKYIFLGSEAPNQND